MAVADKLVGAQFAAGDGGYVVIEAAGLGHGVRRLLVGMLVLLWDLGPGGPPDPLPSRKYRLALRDAYGRTVFEREGLFEREIVIDEAEKLAVLVSDLGMDAFLCKERHRL